MMKTLFATTAAVALAAGMSIAAAQGTGGTPGATGAAHGQMEKQGSAGKGGSEKSERTGQKAGEKNERMGQKSGEKNERTGQKNEEKNERMGQKAGEKNERTGQKAGEKNERTGQKAGEKNERTGERAGEKNERTGERAGEKGERTTAARSVQLSSEQRERIHTVIGSRREARVDHVDFALSVGTRVPRTVHMVPLPEEIVRLVPQYRGFYYILVRDEVVIIDRDTLEIVAVLPA
jgi:Protein of unknown function (DUF1236)